MSKRWVLLLYQHVCSIDRRGMRVAKHQKFFKYRGRNACRTHSAYDYAATYYLLPRSTHIRAAAPFARKRCWPCLIVRYVQRTSSLAEEYLLFLLRDENDGVTPAEAINRHATDTAVIAHSQEPEPTTLMFLDVENGLRSAMWLLRQRQINVLAHWKRVLKLARHRDALFGFWYSA